MISPGKITIHPLSECYCKNHNKEVDRVRFGKFPNCTILCYITCSNCKDEERKKIKDLECVIQTKNVNKILFEEKEKELEEKEKELEEQRKELEEQRKELVQQRREILKDRHESGNLRGLRNKLKKYEAYFHDVKKLMEEIN